MQVKVRFFARYREMTGQGESAVEVEEGTTVAQLLKKLSLGFPELDNRHFLIAVNAEYATLEQPLRHGDEVAIIPPVSGGEGV